MKDERRNRKLSRRAMLRASLTGTGAVLLAACGNPPASSDGGVTAASTAGSSAASTAASAAPSTAAAASASPSALSLPAGAAGKLTVIHRTEYFEGVQNKFRDLVTQFAASKGTELDISTANPEAFGDFNAKMQAAVQAGTPPDLAYHTLSIPQLHFLDILEDVTDVVEEARQKYGEIVPATAEKNAQIDGKWWAVPFMSNTGAWFARKDAFEAAGVDLSKLTDYNSYRDAALKVSDPSKEMWGWGLTINKSGDGHGLITHVIQSFGSRFVDQTGQKVTFNSPETVQAVTWLKETYTSDTYKKMLPPGIESWTDVSNNESYLAGKIALTNNAFTVYTKAKQDNNPVFGNTAVLQVPLANDGTRLVSGANGWFTIFKGAKNVDLAKQAILHMLDPKNFMSMVTEGGGLFLPAYKNLWTDDVLKLDPNFATLQEIIFNPTAYTGQAFPANPNAAIAGIDAQAILSQMMANVNNGSMTPEQAVEDAHNKMVQIFEELGLPQS